MTVGVARQHAGITGQVENCQTVVFLAYVTARAHTLFDFRLYLPKQWCEDHQRRGRAQVPEDTVFATKTEQGTGMVTEAVTGGVPFGWAAGGEVYGRSSKLHTACEAAGKGYVFAVPVSFTVTTPAGRKATAAGLARLVPARCWETRSCGKGCKGHRDHQWALVATSSPRHWLLIRRKTIPLTWRSSTATPPDWCPCPSWSRSPARGGPWRSASSRARGKPDLTSTSSASGTPSAGTPCCPCAPSHCSPSRPPGRPAPWRPGPLPVQAQPPGRRPPPASPASRNTGATPASCPSVPASSLLRTWA